MPKTRTDIEEENKQLRNELRNCRAQIKDYEQRIDAIKLVYRITQKKIADNNDLFFELGKK